MAHQAYLSFWQQGRGKWSNYIKKEECKSVASRTM